MKVPAGARRRENRGARLHMHDLYGALTCAVLAPGSGNAAAVARWLTPAQCRRPRPHPQRPRPRPASGCRSWSEARRPPGRRQDAASVRLAQEVSDWHPPRSARFWDPVEGRGRRRGGGSRTPPPFPNAQAHPHTLTPRRAGLCLGKQPRFPCSGRVLPSPLCHQILIPCGSGCSPITSTCTSQRGRHRRSPDGPVKPVPEWGIPKLIPVGPASGPAATLV